MPTSTLCSRYEAERRHKRDILCILICKRGANSRLNDETMEITQNRRRNRAAMPIENDSQ